MSLGIAIKGPEGIVLAAESRTSMTGPGFGGAVSVHHFDSTHKVLSFSPPHNYVGALTYGVATIGARSIHSFVSEFESQIAPLPRMKVDDFAKRFSDFYLACWAAQHGTVASASEVYFTIAGFDEGSPYGRLFTISIPNQLNPTEILSAEFGFHRGGQSEVVDRLLRGYDVQAIPLVKAALNLDQQQIDALIKALEPLSTQIPLAVMGLQSYVDLSIFWIRSTITAQSLSNSLRGCGGPIDVATITRVNGLSWIQRKSVCGETL